MSGIPPSRLAAGSGGRGNAQQRAFNSLVTSTRKRVAAYVRRISPDGDDVADLMDETYMRAWIARREMLQCPNPSAAIIAYARAVGREWVATHRRLVAVGGDVASFESRARAADEDSIPQELAVARREWAERVLARLSEQQRAAVELHVWWHFEYDVVAEVLELSEAGVRARVHRGLMQLRRVVAEDPFPVDAPAPSERHKRARTCSQRKGPQAGGGTDSPMPLRAQPERGAQEGQLWQGGAGVPP